MDDRHSEVSAPGSKGQAGIVNAVKDRATAQLSNQKGRATEGLDVIAQAVRKTTEQLREDQHDTLAHYIDRAAEELERFSNSVRNRNINELVRDTQQLARRQPALFIGGSFLVGVLVARFLKSSGGNGAEERSPHSADTMGRGGPLNREGDGAHQREVFDARQP